jgi:DNA-binding CsgD family transcriptional regulator
MKSQNPPTTFRMLARYWGNQPFATPHEIQPDSQKRAVLSKPLFSLGPHFSYSFDMRLSSYLQISPEIEYILGYRPEVIKREGISFLDRAVHQEDKEVVLMLHAKAWEFILQKPSHTRMEYCMSIDYRIRKANGTYIRLLQQNCVLLTDKAGNILQTYSICTNISHWNKNHDITLTIKRRNGETYCFKASPQIVYNEELNKISPREREVIQQICRGQNTSQISDRLHISPHTVSTHRKAILRKLGIKGTAALVRFATKNSLV